MTELVDQNKEEIPFEEIPRYKYKNPLKYDELTLAKRQREVTQGMREYPQVSRQQMEDIWDYIYIVGEEKIEENIKKGVYDKPAEKREFVEGSIEIINPPVENEFLSLESLEV